MDIDIRSKLLDANLYESVFGEPPLDTFSACLNSRGLYESQRFALRLSPIVHELVNSLLAKSEAGDESFSYEELQAYSTYLHETIHWWQHKGSTSGFIRSILYPVQTHSNMSDLHEILKAFGPQKPVQTLALKGELGLIVEADNDAVLLANTVTNNFMDTEFYLALTLKPSLDKEIYRDPYFEAAGHSFLITYSLVLGALRDLIDSDGKLFPDPKIFIDNLARLKQQKAKGYYYGSPVIRAPVGLIDLYEGQARFIQLQFLSYSSGISLAEAKKRGMLDGVYGNAFRAFLKISDSIEPSDIESPIVSLFLLICDMSINPTIGFPAAVESFEQFFLDADPGIRFAMLCGAVATDVPELKIFIKDHSKEEYQTVAKILSDATGLRNHLEDLLMVDIHARDQVEARKLIEEHRSFKFSRNNIALRLLTGEFISFIKDRLENPEFFCWTGFWLAKCGGEAQRQLWLNNLSLFADKPDGQALFPRKHPARDESDVLEVFNQFYAAVLIYNLTKQWVLESGPFKKVFLWLADSADSPEFIKRVNDIFRKHYGVDIGQFVLLDKVKVPDS